MRYGAATKVEKASRQQSEFFFVFLGRFAFWVFKGGGGERLRERGKGIGMMEMEVWRRVCGLEKGSQFLFLWTLRNCGADHRFYYDRETTQESC